MRLEKKGKIFEADKIKFNQKNSEFAQSPQTLLFDNFIRIFFSTRIRDALGGFISQVAFVDMDLDLKTIISTSVNPVMSLGDLGTFDEHGIFPFSPFRDNHRVLAYTCGWSRRKSVPVETSIGLVESFDNGVTFKRLFKGPVLSSSLHEPMLVGDGFVLKNEGKYHMWYIFGNKWIERNESEPVARVYKIGQAISDDGLVWKKNEGIPIIENSLDENECQALPTVIKVGNRFHMCFCYRYSTDFRKNKNRAYKLGFAHSDDLVHWIRVKDNYGLQLSETGWDSEMMCYPHLFRLGNKNFLLYNGNEFGKFGFGLAELKLF